MKANYKPPFSRFVRKAHKPLQLAIEDAVEKSAKPRKSVKPKWAILPAYGYISSASTGKST